MPKFFLHIRDGHDFIENLEGSDLPDIQAAREEAEASIREMFAERIRRRQLSASPVIEVHDFQGIKVAEFSLPDSLP